MRLKDGNWAAGWYGNRSYASSYRGWPSCTSNRRA
ncbi:hypothetical protein [Actinomadura sp. NAK00032]